MLAFSNQIKKGVVKTESCEAQYHRLGESPVFRVRVVSYPRGFATVFSLNSISILSAKIVYCNQLYDFAEVDRESVNWQSSA